MLKTLLAKSEQREMKTARRGRPAERVLAGKFLSSGDECWEMKMAYDLGKGYFLQHSDWLYFLMGQAVIAFINKRINCKANVLFPTKSCYKIY